MRALVTNDDGVNSPGLARLARVALDAGLDTVVAAPSWDSSGAGASLTSVLADGRLLLGERTPDAVNGLRVFGLDASPAFIVRTAVTGALGGRPDIVLSGINSGPNTGHAVLHSGTVGAALTAATFGLPAMAVSIGVGDEGFAWDTAAEVASIVLRWLLRTGEPLVLNVNVPNVAAAELRGIRRSTLAAFGAVQTVVTETGAGYVRLAYEEVEADQQSGTDVAALAAGEASVTAIRAVCVDHDAGVPDVFELS